MTIFRPEDEALREGIRRWVNEQLAPDAGAWDDAGDVPPTVLVEAGDLGYLGAGQPEEIGGSGGDATTAVVVAEELGRGGALGLALAILTEVHGAAPLLAAAGSGEAAREVFTGKRRAVFIAGHGTQVRMSEGNLEGEAHAVLGAQWADLAVVAVGDVVAVIETPSGGWDAAVPPGQLGWRTGGLADVRLGSVKTIAVSQGDDTRAMLAAVRERLWLLEAAAAVAAAWAGWDRARSYALEREAFGRPIARFQVNRHALADLATRLTAARELVHDAAIGAASVAAARLYAADVAVAVAERCVQLHGGFGYTMEFAAQRDWRDAQMLAVSTDRAELEASIATRLTVGRTDG